MAREEASLCANGVWLKSNILCRSDRFYWLNRHRRVLGTCGGNIFLELFLPCLLDGKIFLNRFYVARRFLPNEFAFFSNHCIN